MKIRDGARSARVLNKKMHFFNLSAPRSVPRNPAGPQRCRHGKAYPALRCAPCSHMGIICWAPARVSRMLSEFVSSRFFHSEMQRQRGKQAPYFCPIELSTLANKIRPPPPPQYNSGDDDPDFSRKTNRAISQTSALYWGVGVDELYWRW